MAVRDHMEVATTQRLIDRGIRLSLRLRQFAADELREARVGLGLSQEAVGRAAGLSRHQVSRIERAVLPSVTLEQLCRIGAVLGLDLSIKFYPGGQPLRDQGQMGLLERFRRQVGRPIRCRTEVAVPIEGDKRAWDMWIDSGSRAAGVEAETKLRDCQAVQRRIALKARDSHLAVTILVVADTHANRAAVRAAAESLAEMFPVPARVALRELRAGRIPTGSALILL